MNKNDILKVLEQSNKNLGKLTDKQHAQYVSEGHKKQVKQRASKGGSKTLKGKGYTDIQKKANQTSTKIRIEKFKSILNLITKEVFTYKDVRYACEKFGIIKTSIEMTAKRILREKLCVKQIHKGYNQHDPSLYVKIK
jgi:hypothetical protein